MRKHIPQCDADIRIEGLKGLYCCTLKNNHKDPFHRFEVLWSDLEAVYPGKGKFK